MVTVIAVVLMMISLLACASKPESITIMSASSPSWLLRFAQDQKYFAANGLDVTITEPYSGGAGILNALAKGEGDMAG